MLAGFLTAISAIGSTLLTINTAAEIGGKIHRGLKQSKQNRAERRWQMSPQKAARLLRAELHRAGQPVKNVKPALDRSGVWRLLVEGTTAYPDTYEGYPVTTKDARESTEARVDARPGTPVGPAVEVGRGGRGGGRGRGGRGPGFRGGRRWGGPGWGGGVYPWWGGWGPLYIRRRRNEMDEIEAELDEETQLARIKRKRAALGG